MSLSVGATPAFGSLNAYWGQKQGYRLRDICDAGVQYATVSFITTSPEHGDGYPVTNFGANCAAETFPLPNGGKSQLLSECHLIKEDIPYCQSKGVKVLLAIGGESGDYRVSTRAKGVEFGDFLYNAFGPYKDTWKGPRPFDNGDQHVSVDGFDLDLENNEVTMSPYIAMVQHWRRQSQKLFITAAPQCVLGSERLKLLIKQARLDALFVQFYNNPVCDYIPGNEPGDKFSYDEWAKEIASGESKDAKIFVGLPAVPTREAAGSGYVEPENLKKLVCETKDKPNFGGISLWDGTLAKSSGYFSAVLDALKYGCGAPVSTSSASISSTTISSSASASTSSAAISSSTSASTSSAAISSSTSASASSVAISSSTSAPAKALPTSEVTSESPSPVPTIILSTGGSSSLRHASITSGFHWSNSTKTTTGPTVSSADPAVSSVDPAVSSADPAASTSGPVSLTTSTVFTTKVHTVTACPPYVADCPTGKVVTETIPLYTTVCPVTQSAQSPKPTVNTEGPLLTTSTVYTTKTYTITACPSSVTDCPKGKVTTEVVPAYTTVCPVTEAAQSPKPTATSTGLLLTTSTVYTTKTFTITACPSSVTNCPTGKVTTEVVPAYTTVCPVTEAAQSSKPTATSTGLLLTTSTVYTTKTFTITACPSSVTNCPTGKVTTEVIPAYTTVCPVQEVATKSGKPSQPTGVVPGSGDQTTTSIMTATTTIYNTVKVHKVHTIKTQTVSTVVAPSPSNEACVGPECPGVAIPSTGWNSSFVGASVPPATAGASTLLLSLTGLVALVAVQVWAI
ncbi:chitinase 18-18 [Moelleriella libera RCEF 2490]|uniref:chitinase n=1 Tax=Moelleriella libera RCEF 2490 TaxID=1081109 RepID=A0A168C3C0_9HYPO|nr:chitinase 18-18 [Moelleriella libera RCEF 2490]